MHLSVLDQTPIPAGTTPAQALANTVDLAQVAERLGYERYWLAEHHASGGLAGSVPEVLIAHVAAQTSTIRVGSGGVMLSHYSPLKVAEAFRMLETLHPGRIDLGLGRAPGSEPLTAFALQRNRQHQNTDDFVDQLAELVAWLNDAFPEQHPFARITATPVPDNAPDIWLLSSSGFSSAVAAHFGTGLCFAHFISEEGGPESIADYKARFVPSSHHKTPAAAVGVGVICAETDEAAQSLATSAALWRLRRRKGENGPVPSVEEAAGYAWTGSDLLVAGPAASRTIVGDPDTVKRQMTELADRYGVDDLVVVTITHDHAARVRSYELLAEAFGLSPGSAGLAVAAASPA
jgi:luciferase family oxidoreductase group 1